MKEQIELENKTGKFKILGSTNEEVLGEVTLKKGKFGKLRIFRSFNGKNYFNSIDKKNNKIGTVIGKLVGGLCITLHDCELSHPEFSFNSDLYIYNYYFSDCFIGSGCQYENENEFNKISFNVAGLEDYFNENNHSTTREGSDINIKISMSEQEEIEIDENFKIIIDTTYLLGERRLNKITLKTISIEFKSSKEIDYLVEKSKIFANYFSFAFNKSIIPTNIKLYRKKEENDKIQEVYYLYRPGLFDKVKTSEDLNLNWPDYFIDYKKERFQDLIRNWFDIYRDEKIYQSLTIFFAVMRKFFTHSEGEFLALTQCTESFHTIMFKEQPFDPDYYKRRMDDCLEIIKDEDVDLYNKFKGVLNSCNSFPLRERLKKLYLQEDLKQYSLSSESISYNEEGNINQQIIQFTKDEFNKFLSKIIETRNYNTHPTVKKGKNVVGGTELIKLNYKIKGLYRLLIMKSLGLTSEEISQIVKNNQRLRQELYFYTRIG